MMILCEDPRITELNEAFPAGLEEIVDSMEVVYCPQCGDEAPDGRLHKVLDEDLNAGHSAVELMCNTCVVAVPGKFRLL
jgi:hypothetical protein